MAPDVQRQRASAQHAKRDANRMPLGSDRKNLINCRRKFKVIAINRSPEIQAMISRARVFSLMGLVTVRPNNAMTISDGIAVSGTRIPKINNWAWTLASPAPAVTNGGRNNAKNNTVLDAKAPPRPVQPPIYVPLLNRVSGTGGLMFRAW